MANYTANLFGDFGPHFSQKFYDIAKNYPEGTFICLDAVGAKVEVTFWRVVLYIILSLITILVVLGNTMVITAVVVYKKLQTRNSAYIVSLAVSDLFIGLIILPLSGFLQVFRVWLFSDSFCKVWLALDVLTCTASILNLCAISLDRYLAVKHPMSHQYRATLLRTLFIIAVVYVAACAITLPPILAGRDLELRYDPRREYRRAIYLGSLIDTTYGNVTMSPAELARYSFEAIFVNGTLPPPSDSAPRYVCPFTCNLTNDLVYVLYSAGGSFIAPLIFMAYSYTEIYRAAKRAAKASKRGYLVTGGIEDTEETRLRIHRGGQNIRGTVHRPARQRPVPDIETTSFITMPVPSTSDGSTTPTLSRSDVRMSPIPSTSDVRTGKTDTIVRVESSDVETTVEQVFTPPRKPDSPPTQGNGGKIVCKVRHYAEIAEDTDDENTCIVEVHQPRKKGEPTPATDIKPTPAAETDPTPATVMEPTRAAGTDPTRETTQSEPEITIADPGTPEQCKDVNKTVRAPGTASTGNTEGGCLKAVQNRVVARVARRIAGVSKAGRTSVLVLGSFCMCWFPFFFLYMYRGFCTMCVNETVFSVFFWFGYFNSALNPVIYACLTPDFREAFRYMWRTCFRKRGKKAKRNRRNCLKYVPMKDESPTGLAGLVPTISRRLGTIEEV